MTKNTSSFLSAVEATLGEDMLEKIRVSKVLVVGAGGIGTELLKNLALTGFNNVEAIDLDTIDVSNLNRQLLFRSQHVGMPKCTVACQVAAQMTAHQESNGAVRYIPHHGNVCDNTTFNVHFIQQFDIVLNALDNVTARRRVNRLCLAAAVPLVEAGTTGYLGQCSVIDKESNVACYECKTQETPKVFPICTIRSTPSMPVHCIVWAKECYKLLFRNAEESMLYEDIHGQEPSTYMESVLEFRKAFITKRVTQDQIQVLLTKLFVDEIQKQLDMDRYKTARKTPVPLSIECIQQGLALEAHSTENWSHTDVWTDCQCVAEFAACIQQADPDAVIPFDKDDPMGMRFVTAAANLRSYVFGIDVQSYYAAKGIAGNIVPAIATTNAIAAGLQILQAFHVLRTQLRTKQKVGGLAECCAYINCMRLPTRNGLLLTSSRLDPPNPNCFVCRKATIPLSLTVENWTFSEFLDKIVKQELGFEEPTIMLEGDCIWEEGDDADPSFQGNRGKLLPSLPCGGIQHGTVIHIEDFSQDLEVEVAISNQTEWKVQEGETEADLILKYVVGGNKPAVKANNRSLEPKKDHENGDKDSDVEFLMEDMEKKRPAETSNGFPSKKTRVDGLNDVVDVIEVG